MFEYLIVNAEFLPLLLELSTIKITKIALAGDENYHSVNVRHRLSTSILEER